MQTKMIGLVLLIGAAALASCSRHDKPADASTAQAFNVPTTVVAAATLPGYVELTGSVSGARSVVLSTKLMSEITFLAVKEGQRVHAGEVLVRIDDADIQALRGEAFAYRAEAAAAMKEVDAVVAQGEAGKAQAVAAQQQAQAALEDAQRDFERAERLAAEDSIPRAQRDKAELGMKIAEENLHRAEAAVQQAEASVAQAASKRPQIDAKEQQAAAKDEQAAALQDYAVLKAPFDGVVTKKLFEPGQLAIPGQPILQVEDTSGYKVMFSVPDNLVSQLALGQAIDVTFEDGAAELVHTGTLAVLGAAADPGSHTVHAELALPPDDGLFSGRFARVRVPSGEKHVLMIPAACVIREGELTSVWRVSPAGVLSLVPVELGGVQGAQVEVIRGLSDGDEIVSQPTAELYSGGRVAQSAAAEQAQ